MNQKRESTEATRNNLRESFWALYTQKPIEKITVKEVTDLAGYNRGTFYLYYRDVYDILNRIEQGLLEKIGGFASYWMEEDIGELWRQHVTQLIEWFHDNTMYLSVLMSGHGDPGFSAKLKDVLRPVISKWISNPNHLSKSEAEILIEFQLSGVISALSTWLSQNDTLSFEEFVGFMMKTFF